MTKHEISDILTNIANYWFNRNLIDIGVGGSFYSNDYPMAEFHGSDVDCIVVLKKMDLPSIKNFIEDASSELKVKVSVIPMTELALQDRYQWPDKMITMIYKGIVWIYGNLGEGLTIERGEAAELTRRLLPEAIYRIQRDYLAGKVKLSRAYDLLLQYLVILK